MCCNIVICILVKTKWGYSHVRFNLKVEIYILIDVGLHWAFLAGKSGNVFH